MQEVTKFAVSIGNGDTTIDGHITILSQNQILSRVNDQWAAIFNQMIIRGIIFEPAAINVNRAAARVIKLKPFAIIIWTYIRTFHDFVDDNRAGERLRLHGERGLSITTMAQVAVLSYISHQVFIITNMVHNEGKGDCLSGRGSAGPGYFIIGHTSPDWLGYPTGKVNFGRQGIDKDSITGLKTAIIA